MTITVDTARTAPRTADAVGVPVATDGPVPRSLKLNRAALTRLGFEGKVGQTLVVPDGGATTLVAVGIGPAGSIDPSGLRDAAAALARAASFAAHLATSLVDVEGVDDRTAAQVVTEGVLLASYRYLAMKSTANAPRLARLTLVGGSPNPVASGIARGEALAGAGALARDLANTPPGKLTARQLAERAVEVGRASGLGVEVLDEHAIAELGLGGLLGVNAGSVEPPRLVKLTYSPRNPAGHVALVGKGVMYDSGGISLKPSDGMHVNMKMDMTGAASVLSAMSALKALRCRAAVTGFLMLTDNMPSGSALKLGDVLTFRNGKTAEIHNTDAEGRLILADGLALAVEERPDAVIDIATLTGACLVALGTRMAGVLGTDQDLVDQVIAAGRRVDEPAWQLPLEPSYRKLLDSNVADFKNVGGPYGGVITAALFLREFVGDVPWAHLDIAGPMAVDADDAWRSRGATGFGARLLAEVVTSFRRP